MQTPARDAAARPPSWRDLFWPGVAVLGVQVFCAFGFWHLIDLNPADECIHVLEGMDLLRGRVDPVRFVLWSGPYAALYAGLLAFVPVDAVQDCTLALALLASTLLLFWALATRSVAGAALLACSWATASFLFVGHRAVYLFGAAWIFLAVGLLVRQRSLAGALAFLMAAFVRPEAQAWMLGIGALYLLRRRTRGVGSALVLTALALAALQASTNVGHMRSWLAFTQHYAGERAMRDVPAAASAHDLSQSGLWRFAHPEETIHADFGNAASIGDALRQAPARFLEHVAHNALALPERLVRLLAPFPGVPTVGLVVGVLLFALALLGALRCIRSRCASPFTPILLASPLLLVSGLLFAPYTTFLLPLALPLYLLVLEALEPLLERMRTDRAVVRACALTVALLAVSMPRPLDVTPRRVLLWRDLVSAFWEMRPKELLYPREPYAIGALLPPGTRFLTEPSSVAAESLCFLHVQDLVAGSARLLAPAEQLAFDALLTPGAWRVAEHLPSVLVLERVE